MTHVLSAFQKSFVFVLLLIWFYVFKFVFFPLFFGGYRFIVTIVLFAACTFVTCFNKHQSINQVEQNCAVKMRFRCNAAVCVAVFNNLWGRHPDASRCLPGRSRRQFNGLWRSWQTCWQSDVWHGALSTLEPWPLGAGEALLSRYAVVVIHCDVFSDSHADHSYVKSHWTMKWK